MTINTQQVATMDGKDVYEITLQTGDIQAVVYNYGCIMKELWLPDRVGKSADIILGFDDLDGYQETTYPYYGAVIGRVANRIKDGKFNIDGVEYHVGVNQPEIGAHLHGGVRGFDKQVWDFELKEEPAAASVIFQRLSPDGEEGYPGNVDVTFTIKITAGQELFFIYTATTDKTTPLNLTNHNYYNLGGHKSGLTCGHVLTINSDQVLHMDSSSCPTGKLIDVAGTSKDFNQPARMFEQMVHNVHEPSGLPYGFDYAYVLNGGDRDNLDLDYCATLYDPSSGRKMSIYTDMPGVQLFNHCSFGGIMGKNGARYEQFSAICLETQLHPNFSNVPEFGIEPLKPGEVFQTQTRHVFTVE